ncbi:hypothetical protein L596_008914 [Steinernema carpocapsae]|uniref:Uncharacterized protein n=1 Tax=Steinernema carpocapsae TaxID=34508 RepID=A0A4U5PED6_STECR|nr:hypothetical protein L596_008914 [Steinernema carpocapsae]
MQLKLLLCFLLVLPVTLANCVDDYKRTLFLIGRLRQYATDNLEWVCGQNSREQIIQYMIKMLEELFLRLQLPYLDTVNNLKFLALLNQINLFLNSMCNLGCPMNMAQLLQTVLEDIEWLKTL